jgi:transposase
LFNNEMLTRISSIMARHGLGAGAFVYVADSAMVTSGNLAVIGDATRFVSRLPATYSACSQAVTEAVEANAWTYVGRLSENPGTTNRPGARYKTCETTVELNGRSYRAVVVHSDSHDKRRQKKLDKDLLNSERELAEQLKNVATVYHCEPDARDAAEKVGASSSRFHRAEVEIRTIQKRRPGRPPKNRPAPMQTKYELVWTLTEKSDAVAAAREEAGCFVLLSNVPKQGVDALDAAELLQAYKGQFGVENNFAFLKDPLVVNDTFLKAPRRIEVLGMILIIALLIWRLMERSMRSWVNNSGETLPGWDGKQTRKPTSFMMTTVINGIQVIAPKKGPRFLFKGPSPTQLAFLNAMGIDESVFCEPNSLCEPIIPREPAAKG